jgi:hypothetical protein
MAARCTICTHVDRAAIDRALVAGTPSLRELAAQHGVSAMALHRHGDVHLPDGLTKAKDAQLATDADTLLARLTALLGSADEQLSLARGIVGRAVKAGDLRAASSALAAGNGAIRECRGVLALLLEVEGRIERAPVVNVTLTSEWLVIMDALGPFPEARIAVAARLKEVA